MESIHSNSNLYQFHLNICQGNSYIWRSKNTTQVMDGVYLALKDCREFRLRDQMNSAAVSIPSNIAEGAEKIGILAPTTTRPLIAETKEIASMLQGLINSKKP